MARQPGTKDSRPDRPESIVSFLARTVIFILLAAFGLAIVAGVVLLPAYARLNDIELERASLDAANQDDRKRIAARDNLIKDMPNDPTLTKRIAMRHFGSMPRTEHVVAATEDLRAPAPGTVYIEPTARPKKTENWITALATKVNRPNGVMTLTILAFIALLAAVFLTGARRRKPTPAQAPVRSKPR